jgi:hypothetical protein
MQNVMDFLKTFRLAGSRLLRAGVLCSVFALNVAPSARAEAPSRIEVTLTSDNQFQVLGEKVPLTKLPDRLKSAGATRETAVVIAVPKETPQSTLAAVSGKLRSAGFPRMAFSRPRYVDARAATNSFTSDLQKILGVKP